MADEVKRETPPFSREGDYNLFGSSHTVRKASQSSCILETGGALETSRLGADFVETNSLMGDHSGTGDSSPLHRSGSRAPGSGTTSTRASSAAIGRLDSGASSPLLQTEMMPEEDGCVCPYCHRDYRKPRVLDCLHSMCEDCIIAQLDGRRDKQAREQLEKRLASTDCVLQDKQSNDRPTPPGVIKCPTCSQESHVGNDIRFVHSMLIDFVRNAASGDAPAERNCRSCKSDLPAVAYCRQCGTDLCPNCLQAHKDMRMFEGHEVMSYDELEKAGRAGEVRRVLCPIHGLPYLVLCAGCEALACRNCLDQDHLTHKIVDVTPVVVKAISHELIHQMEKVSNKWSIALESWHSEADRASTLMSHFENAKATIDLAYEEAARVLEASRLKKHQELEEARDRQEETIEEVYRKVDITQTRIDGAIKFSNRLLDSANGVELLASRKKVLHQLNSLEHTMPSLHTESELRFAPVMKKTLEATFRNAVGDIISQALPSSMSAVSLDNSGSTITRISAAESEWAAVNGMKEARGDIGGERGDRGDSRRGTGGGGGGVEEGGRGDGVGVIGGGGGDRGGQGGGRGGGGGAPPSTSLATSTITPIGGERAARAKAGVSGGVGMGQQSAAAAAAFAGGWPPSSNPPELPSPSPPKDPNNTAIMNSRGVGGESTNTQQLQQLQQQQSSNQQAVAIPTSQQQQQVNNAAAAAVAMQQLQAAASAAATTPTPNGGGGGGLPPWAAAALNPAAGADPRLAAAVLQAAQAAGGFPGAAAAKQLQMALFLQQQQQQHGNLALRQFGAAAAAAENHLLLRQMVAAGAAAAAAGNDQAILAAGLGKNVHEIKLAFAHGTGTAGNSLRELHSPGGFAVAENDEILIADTNNHRIVVITPAMPWKFGRPGQEDGQLCFPRRVVAMKGFETARYVVIDKAVDNKSRAQLFGHTGEFIRRINLTAVVPKGGIEVWAATSTPTGHLVMVDQSSVIYTLDIKEAQPRVVNWVDASNHLMEASDVAVHEKSIYVTDFRGHGVHVFSHEGTYLRKIGEPSHTPFPIGIDVARSGELLIAHTHGNKLTIVCYSPEGTLQHQFVNCDFRVRVEQMSRCAALRCTSTGHIVTLSKHAHTLYGFRRIMAPRS